MRIALTHLVIRASEKIRKQKLLANAIGVHISRSPHDDRREYYSNAATFKLIVPTDDARKLIPLAQHLLKSIYLSGCSYQRAGVLLLDLTKQHYKRQDLFEAVENLKSDELMKALDIINAKMGSGKLRFAGEDFDAGWRLKQRLRSPRYTTQFSELKTVK